VPNSITPSIGRKVWYFDPQPGNVYNPLQAFDATVIYVWNPDMVSLRVTDHAGQTFVRTSVPLRDHVEGDCHGVESVATWMPYQVKTAGKA
jgi:hypothetical protein